MSREQQRFPLFPAREYPLDVLDIERGWERHRAVSHVVTPDGVVAVPQSEEQLGHAVLAAALEQHDQQRITA